MLPFAQYEPDVHRRRCLNRGHRAAQIRRELPRYRDRRRRRRIGRTRVGRDQHRQLGQVWRQLRAAVVVPIRHPEPVEDVYRTVGLHPTTGIRSTTITSIVDGYYRRTRAVSTAGIAATREAAREVLTCRAVALLGAVRPSTPDLARAPTTGNPTLHRHRAHRHQRTEVGHRGQPADQHGDCDGRHPTTGTTHSRSPVPPGSPGPAS